jgi:Stress up-regulated Nod 19
VKRLIVIAGLAIGMALVGLAPAQPAQAATSTRMVRYGPFTIPGGTATDPGMIHNRLLFGVTRPCVDCHITGFEPDLVDQNGASVNMDSGPMLHHMVLTSQWRRDATCAGSWLGLAGERFFASGNERTKVAFPAGYGYRVRYYDSWNLLVDLMNHAATSKTVYVQVTFTIRPSWESVKRLKPVWLDIDQCGDSEYSIPAGFSDTHRDWNVNVPGRIVAMIGHLHGHGVAIEATNESRGGELICRSDATLDPMDPHRVLSMETCVGDPVATVASGEVVRLHSMYQSSHPADDVMGIMLGYINST